MKKQLLITGSNGFIGSHLKKQLQDKGYDTVDYNTREGDLSQAEPTAAGIECVFHLAGKSFVPDSWKTPADFYKINTFGTLNVLEFCRKNKSALIFISSYVYGIPETLPIDESHPVNPANPYAHSKYMAEQLCTFYAKNFQIPVTIVRPFNIYGPGLAPYFLISEIMKQLLSGDEETVELADLSPKRDYLYIDDFTKALVLLLEKKEPGVFNIGAGYSMSVKEIVEIMIKICKRSKKVTSKKIQRKNEIPDVVADIGKINKLTGWKPEISFEEGINRMLKSGKNIM